MFIRERRLGKVFGREDVGEGNKVGEARRDGKVKEVGRVGRKGKRPGNI